MAGMTGAERTDVMLRMTIGPNNGIAFSPDGTRLLTATALSALAWDAAPGRPAASFGGTPTWSPRSPSRRTGPGHPGRLSTLPAAMAPASCAWSRSFCAAYRTANSRIASVNRGPFPR